MLIHRGKVKTMAKNIRILSHIILEKFLLLYFNMKTSGYNPIITLYLSLG